MTYGILKEIDRTESIELGLESVPFEDEKVMVTFYHNRVVHIDKDNKKHTTYRDDLDLKIQIKYWGL